MRSLEDHLSPHELASLPGSPEALASGGPGQQQMSHHLNQCEVCSSLAQTHWRLLSLVGASTSVAASEPCPSQTVWLEFATGLHSERTSVLLAHAVNCATCADALHDAMELMRPQVDAVIEPIEDLASATSEWQHRIAAQMSAATTSPRIEQAPKLNFVRYLGRPPVWISLAAAVILAAFVGSISLWRIEHPSDARLLALAYNKQRTMALRIPGADPVPMASGTRGVTSGLTDPTELIELNLRTQRHLDQTPNSPYWHQVLGEINLLKQDGVAARRNLEIAQATDENLPNLRSDLAAAWFEIGEKSGNAEAYAEAAELYSKQIHDQPSNPSILYYNRALCWQRLSLHENALDDLRSALSFERSPAWRKVIEAEIARLSDRSTIVPTDNYETALAEATEKLLAHWSDSLQARAKITQTAASGLRHHDRWLQDWVAAKHTPVTAAADIHLGASVAAARAGEAQSSLTEARNALDLYHLAHHLPGLLRAQLAEAYALQRLGSAKDCLQSAGHLLAANVVDYSWLHAQSLLEKGSCEAVTGDFREANRDLDRGAEVSHDSNLLTAHLRAVGFQAWTQDFRGLRAAAWQTNVTGMSLCSQMQCPVLTRYQFLHNLVLCADRLGLQYVAAQMMVTAARLASEGGDITAHAYALENLGTLSGLTGDYTAATRAFAQASDLARSGTHAAMAPLYQADWQIDQAEILAHEGFAASALHLLQQNGSVILASNYAPVRLHYFNQLANVQRSLGRSDDALASASAAVHQAEQSLNSLHFAADKEQWFRKNTKSYAELVKVLLQRGEDTEALIAWERFRSAPYANPSAIARTVTADKASNKRILVLARLDDVYIGWLATSSPLRAIQTVSLGDGPKLERQAKTFYRLCSDRDSSLTDVKTVGARLYDTLIKPFEGHLDSTNQLWLDIDPTLAMLPLAALTRPDGGWFGASLQSSVLPAWWTLHSTESLSDLPTPTALHLVVANGFSSEGSVAASEAAEVTRLFPGSTLVEASGANERTLLHTLETADIFHFSGHATMDDGPKLLLSSLGTEHASALTAESVGSLNLRRCKVAVLAACNTTAADPDQLEKLPDLRNALLRSGANTVVASSWDVDDRSTHSLMLAFYNQLALGRSPAYSLYLAQQFLQTSSKWRHPYFWSSFEIFTN